MVDSLTPMRIFLAALILAFPLAAHCAPEEKSSTGGSAQAPAETPAGAWSHLGYHGDWVAQYESQPLPVAVRLRQAAARGDRHAKKRARK